MNSRAVLASSNPGKLREIGAILEGIGIELLPQSYFNAVPVEETGLTYVENALLKARAAALVSGLPAIADDSGIEVDVLDGAPGIYSARYAGTGSTDQQNLNLLLERVKTTGVEQPSARYRCVIVYLRHANDPSPIIADACWEGRIAAEPRGTNGFGYDPIFLVSTHACTSAELPTEIKNRISHRAKALQLLFQHLLKADRPCVD